MTKKTSSEVIDAFRQRHKDRFNTASIAGGMFFLFIVVTSIYIALTGSPELPGLVGLEINTPAYTPSLTPPPTLTPIGTRADLECNCSPQQEVSSQAVVTVIVVVTPTVDTKTTPTKDLAITYVPSSTLTPKNTFTPTPTTILYIVQPKDTLSDIALRFNVTVEEIQAANGMGDSTLIFVGQTLIIPR